MDDAPAVSSRRGRIVKTYAVLLCGICIFSAAYATARAGAIAGIDPRSAPQGADVTVTVTGADTTFFQNGSTVTNVWLSRGNSTIVAASFAGTDATSLSASFDIPFDAEAGTWDVHVSDSVDGQLAPLAGGFVVYAYPDLNADGRVDFKDFAFFAAHWLEEAAAPEDMVWIPSGEFQMGDHFNEGDQDEIPVHRVYVDAFYISRCEITNRQYCSYLNSALSQGLIEVRDGVVYAAGGGTDPYCDTNGIDSDSLISYSAGVFAVRAKDGIEMSDHPTVEVSWYGAAMYCNWRSRQERFQACYVPAAWTCDSFRKGYRLPTEAEWEYAARGGKHDPYCRYPWGQTVDGSSANYFGSTDPYEGGARPWTAPVGYYNGNQVPTGTDMANGYGLYDMAGNVWEWCNDWYSATYYATGAYDNPQGPANGTSRVVRGGAWDDDPVYSRLASRHPLDPDVRYNDTGFRVVLDLE
jgi:sulfatase modifying factor 1